MDKSIFGKKQNEGNEHDITNFGVTLAVSI